jgi:hypothetical protein
MARTPPALKEALDELDAETRAFLRKWRLPMWLGLYLYRSAQTGNPTRDVHPNYRAAVLQGATIPTVQGHRPVMHSIIRTADDTLDPAARHIMRLWRLRERKKQAGLRGDKEGARAAWALHEYLLAHPPSLDHGARNIARVNVERDAGRAAEWGRWQSEADRIWMHRPKLKRTPVAILVKANLGASEHFKTIARRIHPPK